MVANPNRRPDEFMDYNCTYRGVRDWEEKRSMAAITTGVQAVAVA
jgi:salicylate hydroxylase